MWWPPSTIYSSKGKKNAASEENALTVFHPLNFPFSHMKKLTKSTTRYAIHNLHTLSPPPPARHGRLHQLGWFFFSVLHFPRGESGKFWCGLVSKFSSRVIHQGDQCSRAHTIMTWCKFDRLHNLHHHDRCRHVRWILQPIKTAPVARIKIQFGPHPKGVLAGREWRSDGFSPAGKLDLWHSAAVTRCKRVTAYFVLI